MASLAMLLVQLVRAEVTVSIYIVPLQENPSELYPTWLCKTIVEQNHLQPPAFSERCVMSEGSCTWYGVWCLSFLISVLLQFQSTEEVYCYFTLQRALRCLLDFCVCLRIVSVEVKCQLIFVIRYLLCYLHVCVRYGNVGPIWAPNYTALQGRCINVR